jgi:hypothetical protein
MSDEILDHAGLIAALGGAARVAEAPSVETMPVTARAWTARNRIPPEYWPGIIEFAATLNVPVTADWLMRTTPARAGRVPPASVAKHEAAAA